MMKIGEPKITLLASDHPEKARSSTLGPFPLPKPCVIKRKRKEVGYQLTLQTLLALNFLLGKWLKS
eukprot:1160425-Pelagomonas_calceolata.AAC.5